MTAHALEQLAWASMSELAIVRKLARRCVEKRLEWVRGDKGKVRAVVNKVPAIRGDKKRRLEAVAQEIERQKKIQEKRRYEQPIDWSKYRRPSLPRRRQVIAQRHVVSSGSCYALTRIQDHLLLVVSRTWRNAELFVVHPNKSMTRYQLERSFADGVNLVSVLVDTFHPNKVRAALCKGESISFDPCRGATIIHHKDGSSTWLPWKNTPN